MDAHLLLAVDEVAVSAGPGVEVEAVAPRTPHQLGHVVGAPEEGLACLAEHVGEVAVRSEADSNAPCLCQGRTSECWQRYNIRMS